MGLIKSAIAIAIIFIILGTVILGYLGFIPFVSDIFGSNSPRDLGVSYSLGKYDQIMEKGGGDIYTLPADTPAKDSISWSGTHSLDTSFTSSELSSWANYRNWKYFPFRSVQIRVNGDGTIESSGRIIYSKALDYASALGVSPETLKSALARINIPQTDLIYYIKIKGSVSGNRFSVMIQNIEVGRLPLPAGTIVTIQEALLPFIESRLEAEPSFYITKATVEDGELKFVGKLPTIESSVPE